MRALLCFLVSLAPLTAVEVRTVVEEKDLYNMWWSPGFLWAIISIIIVVILIVVVYPSEKKYLDENRPKKDIKLEE